MKCDWSNYIEEEAIKWFEKLFYFSERFVEKIKELRKILTVAEKTA